MDSCKLGTCDALKQAEARVREMEATIDAMTESHAHDDMALTAAYLSGAHEGKKQAEAEMAALRERCGKLERVRRIVASIRFTETYRRFPLAATDAEYAELGAALDATEVMP